MSGKIRPLKTGQGELIKCLDRQIEEQETMRDEIRQEIAYYWKKCLKNIQSPGMSGIDYSRDLVTGGTFQLCFSDAVDKINGLQTNLERILDTIEELKLKRERLIKIYRKDKSIMGKLFYYREVAELSQEKTAEKLGYSVRQVQRMEKKLREQFGVRF